MGQRALELGERKRREAAAEEEWVMRVAVVLVGTPEFVVAEDQQAAQLASHLKYHSRSPFLWSRPLSLQVQQVQLTPLDVVDIWSTSRSHCYRVLVSRD